MSTPATEPYPETLEDIGARLADQVAACTAEVARCRAELRRHRLAGSDPSATLLAYLGKRIAEAEFAVLGSREALRDAALVRDVSAMAAARAAGPPPGRTPLRAV